MQRTHEPDAAIPFLCAHLHHLLLHTHTHTHVSRMSSWRISLCVFIRVYQSGQTSAEQTSLRDPSWDAYDRTRTHSSSFALLLSLFLSLSHTHTTQHKRERERERAAGNLGGLGGKSHVRIVRVHGAALPCHYPSANDSMLLKPLGCSYTRCKKKSSKN